MLCSSAPDARGALGRAPGDCRKRRSVLVGGARECWRAWLAPPPLSRGDADGPASSVLWASKASALSARRAASAEPPGTRPREARGLRGAPARAVEPGRAAAHDATRVTRSYCTPVTLIYSNA